MAPDDPKLETSELSRSKEALRVQPFGVFADQDFPGIGCLRGGRRACLEQRDHGPRKADFWLGCPGYLALPLRHHHHHHRGHRDGESRQGGGADGRDQGLGSQSDSAGVLRNPAGAPGVTCLCSTSSAARTFSGFSVLTLKPKSPYPWRTRKRRSSWLPSSSVALDILASFIR